MSIEKMSLVHIVGNLSNLDETLLRCVKSELFHPETITEDPEKNGFTHSNEQNPYTTIMHQAEEILSVMDIPGVFHNYAKLALSDEKLEDYLGEIYQVVNGLSEKIRWLQDEIQLQEQSLVQIKHMSSLEAKIEDVFTSHHSSARFGRLPADSYLKLDYFKDKNFFFYPFDHDNDYYWGVYLMPSSHKEEIDEIFRSLYFEEYKIPEYLKGTPEFAVQNLTEQIRNNRISLQELEVELNKIRKEHYDTLQAVYSKVKMLHDTFGFRRYAVSGHNKFHLEGFVPQKQVKHFINLFEDMDTVICDQLPAEADKRLTPPVKLKTCWLFRPFEMFVETYGLPPYSDLNPTSYIGFIYSILFGIMFGDFGQGICVIIVGILLWKLRRMMLGQILTRCGVCSMIFGLLYGSCFGFEGLFHPLFDAIGLGGIFPLDVLDSNTSLTLLILSMGLGILIILVSMGINIYLGLKKRNYSSALFSNNGLAGLLLYGGVILAAILLLVLNINLFNPIFLLCVVILPLVLIFFHEPLGRFVSRRKGEKDSEKFKVVDASFEMFDVLMSYCTNTLSFLRVGGFILSHAALMLVVMQFAHMAGSLGSPFVIVIGNIFVMGLEGLVVSIQVLRLVYYETFSRFYSGDGKPFQPAKVEFESEPKKK